MDDKKYENVALPTMEVPMIEPDSVRQLRQLASQGWGSKRIASELGIARNTVRRYLRGQDGALRQERPNARALTAEERAEALKLFDAEAGGNAAVLTEMLRERGHDVALRTVQKVTAERRRQRVASALATVRFETAPGAQMQIDFGQKMVEVGDKPVRVFFLVAVLNSQLFQSTLAQQDHCQQPTDGHSIGPVIAREPLKNFLNSFVVNHNATLAIGRWHDGLPKANHALGTRAIKPCSDGKIKALKSVRGIFTDGGHAGSTGRKHLAAGRAKIGCLTDRNWSCFTGHA